MANHNFVMLGRSIKCCSNHALPHRIEVKSCRTIATETEVTNKITVTFPFLYITTNAVLIYNANIIIMLMRKKRIVLTMANDSLCWTAKNVDHNKLSILLKAKS